ncbi:MAG: HEAT repeat domain-containing protein [Acidobacteria bacterium]|nr:HEAT repeat domain-containing protein [Acidobacteriota bacterium]
MPAHVARDDDGIALDPLPADTAALLNAFARACKAAARAVVLYPAEHPTVAGALWSLATAAQTATAAGTLTIAVTPDTLTVGRRQIAKPDAAVTELAALLHAHQVGQLIVQSQTDAELWRRFLTVLAVPPDQARLRGGLPRLWSSEGQSGIEVRRINFDELLRERIRGDRATWERIVAECLEGNQVGLDDWTINLISEILERPGKIGELFTAINEQVSGEGTGGAEALGGLLHAVAQFVGRTQPDALDSVMSAIADAAARLPVATLGPMLKASKAGTRASLGRFVADLARRVQDGTIADMIATEVRSGRGTSSMLADAFCGLAPDRTRRSAILNLARKSVERGSVQNDATAASAWQSSEDFLLTYSDERFVSDAYDGELRRIADRAVELDRDQTDPPDRIAAWAHSVDESAVRLLDAQMLIDLMVLQHDVRRWRELADLAIARIDMLVVVGDFPSATFLVGAMHHQAQYHDEPAVQTAAGILVDHMLNAAMMRHVAAYLDTSDKDTIAGAKRFCHALGTSIVGPLAEVLSREERTRARERLIEILLGLGAAGRQAVERLIQSPNAAVRRTAVLLLSEFGGSNALVDLESLLNDAEPNVQRDATRAIAMMHSEAAFETLTRALSTGTEHARSVITGVLSSIPNDDALPILAYLVRSAPCRGPMWQVYERAVQRLGAIGGRTAVDALADVMNKRVVWAPFKIVVLRRLAAEAIARIGTPDALDALRAAASTGPRGARSAARRHLAAHESENRQ